MRKLNSLPEEVLFEIFQYLDDQDLLSLTTASKVFNDIISSTKLSKRILLKFRKRNRDCSTVGQRRYTKLRIGCFPPSFSVVLHEIGQNLTDLSFKNCGLKFDIVRRILVETPNVARLTCDRVELFDVSRNTKQPLPALKNLHVTCYSTPSSLFRLLHNCSVSELVVQDNIYSVGGLAGFLRTQRKLEHLSLESCDLELFEDSALNDVSFALKSFSLTKAKPIQTAHLKQFLELHSPSLEKLELFVHCCDFSAELNQMRKLKSLTVTNAYMAYLEPLPTVEELTLNGPNNVGEVYTKFPCLKSLTLRRIGSHSILEKISQNMRDLEKVHVFEGSISDLQVPSVKSLTLEKVDRCQEEFFAIHKNIESLDLHYCAFIDDLAIADIARNVRNLKSLSLIGCKRISNESISTIRDECKQLNKIIIRASSESLDWRLLQQKDRRVDIYLQYDG